MRFLSQGGREVFIHSIFQAIPIYYMMCFLLPKTPCSELEGIMAKCWWQKGSGKLGIHWCTGEKLCKPKEIGGLRFRDLVKFNSALLAKQGWRLLNFCNSLLPQVLEATYFPHPDFLDSSMGNLPSLT